MLLAYKIWLILLTVLCVACWIWVELDAFICHTRKRDTERCVRHGRLRRIAGSQEGGLRPVGTDRPPARRHGDAGR